MTSPSSDLADFVAAMGGERSLRVEENLGEGFVRLRVAEAERRQAKHDIQCIEDAVVEMLRNSRDAGARRIFVATAREGERRVVTILDDGSGIPADMQERVFDARVTSKLESMHMDRWGVHGRGMALYSVRENCKSARVVDSAPGRGTVIQVVSDTSSLPEKTDQSTWPSLGKDDDGEQVVSRGPHNIVRACCEFALEERGVCEVYVGSPSEIVATIRRRVRPSVDGSNLLFVDDLTELPALERFSVAADARELLGVCSGVGIDLSERTAHRIIGGQIRPVRSALSHLTHKSSGDSPREVDLQRDRRGLRISRDDADEFSRIMERDFSFLVDRYYLSLAQDPKVRVSRGRVTVTFEVSEGD